MMSSSLYAAVVADVFFWSGCVVAISFLEAWIKFSAPGVTLPIGLSIGRLVFSALNKVEWVLAVAAVGCLWAAGSWTNGASWLSGAVVLLLIETVWLLPALDKRALAYMSDTPPTHSSSMHFLFVAAELVKIICLVVAGIRTFKLI